MLDIQYIRENVEKVKTAALNKKSAVDIDLLLKKDEERRQYLKEVEELKSLKNGLNELISQAASEEERTEIIAKGKEIKEKLEVKEPALESIQIEYDTLLRAVPNVPSDDTPVGADESANQVLRTVGEKKEFSFTLLEHQEIGVRLGLIDTETATAVSGTRFAYLKGEAVLLEFALVQYALSLLTNEEMLGRIAATANLKVSPKAFLPVVPPVFIKPEVYEKMDRLEPKEDRYYLESENLYLTGSAEHTLGPIHMDQILEERTLPLRYLGFSTAFRQEAGTYGKDMKGIMRLHQFDKLEMESFTLGTDARLEQDFFVAIQEYLLHSLDLPYQVVMVCTGDMGKPDMRQIDIETWLPGQGKYRETHTADLMGDYQARRLITRVRREDGSLEYVHMNDATAFAIGRMLVAILENFQEADGGVVIPEVLRPFVGKERIAAKEEQK